MTNEAVTIDELLNAREQMIAEVVGKMPADHRKFVLGSSAVNQTGNS